MVTTSNFCLADEVTDELVAKHYRQGHKFNFGTNASTPLASIALIARLASGVTPTGSHLEQADLKTHRTPSFIL